MKTFKTNKTKKKESKSKEKCKPNLKKKSKEFNVEQYLNQRLQIKDFTDRSIKKSINNKRDLTSAMTISTFIPDKTVSSAFRSKSSYEKHRGPYPIKGILKTNINSFITQQDNVQFTQITPRQSKPLNQTYSIEIKKYKKSEEMAALIIQKAWKKYQTLKVIKRYQNLFKDNLNKKKISPIQIITDLQRTLKIKPHIQTSHQKNKTPPLKIIQFQRENQDKNKSQSQVSIPMGILEQKNLSDSSNLQNYQVIQANSQKSKSSKELKINDGQVFQKLIKKFEYNKKYLVEDLQNKINNLFSEYHKQEYLLSDDSIDNLNINIHNNDDSNKNNHNDSNNFNSSIKNQNDDSQLGSEWCHQYVRKQHIMFQYRLKLLKLRKQIELEKLNIIKRQKNLSFQQTNNKKQRIENLYEKEKKNIEKSRKDYNFIIDQLTKHALKCQKDVIYLANKNKIQDNFRKSFSAESIVLKCILKDSEIQNFLDYQSIPIKEQQNCYHFSPQPSMQSIQEQISTKFMKDTNFDSLQQIFFEFLIKQTINEIYMNDQLYHHIKPYVEDVFNFKKIQDFDIMLFFKDLKKFSPNQQIIQKRMNQKINPSSLDILKIIRNCDYEASQYELVLGQQTFKKYKTYIQQLYEIKKKQAINKIKNPNVNTIQSQNLLEKIILKISEKKYKLQRYYNFQRDLFIMYMKSVFNCYNQLLIQAKSLSTYMNSRSSIGPGQLTMALKQYNKICQKKTTQKIFKDCQQKILEIIHYKCIIPSFKNFNQLELFQSQLVKQLKFQLEIQEFKWVNYMDQVLQIWQQISLKLQENLIQQFLNDLTVFIL